MLPVTGIDEKRSLMRLKPEISSSKNIIRISTLPIFHLAQNREQMFGVNVYAQSLEEKYDLHNPLLEFAKNIFG